MKWLLSVVFLLLAAVSARGETPMSADFYAGYYLDTRGPDPFFRVELPEEVYSVARRSDLGDIRVFNSAGEVVPHALRVPKPPEINVAKMVVPFFPLYGEGRDSAFGDLAVQVVRDNSGTVVTVKNPEEGGGEKPLRGYLLDLGENSRTVGALELHWQAASSSSIFTARIQQSGDLRSWWPLVASAPLVDLRHHGERVEKREIDLPSVPQRYLRLSWSEKEPLRLTNVALVAKSVDDHRQRQWTELGTGVVEKTEGRIDIDYQGNFRVPVSSARLIFSRPNSLAKIDLQSRANAKDRWHSRCRQTFYSLTFGSALVESESCLFKPTSDTEWRAMVEEDGAAIASNKVGPRLQLGRTVSELLFVARGTPPFLLAFGSERLSQDHKAGVESGLVLTALEASEAASRVSQASFGRRIELGGEAVLRPQPPPPPWKTWILWAVLLLGVAMLALMARGLVREMNEKKENAATKDG